jgi:iron complex transport system substrate-binding protein
VAERIVSLLPSATEALWFLGHGSRVVGVTFECHDPPEAATRPHVTDTIVPPGLTPGEIDAVIRQAMEEGRELYRLDRELLVTLDPDLIVSQDLCRVCALPSGDVNAAVAELGCDAAVFSYDPMTLDQVFDQMAALDVAATAAADSAASRSAAAGSAIGRLRERVATVEAAVADRDRPAVLLLEWPDPPFTPGHWIPDQIVAAGGEPLLAHPGDRSEATTWDAVAECGADVLLVAPCGFDEQAANQQLAEVLERPEIANLPAVRNGRCHAVDADGLIVRPGPRLVDGVEALAGLLHPGIGPFEAGR